MHTMEAYDEIIKILTFPFRKLNVFTKKRVSKITILFQQWFSDMRKYLKIIIKKK